MSKHTPGPWCVRHDDMVCSQEGRIIADCESTSYAMRPAPPIVEDKANATLIAAAPELLEELKETLTYHPGVTHGRCGFCGHYGDDCRANRIKALINKAEGREG